MIFIYVFAILAYLIFNSIITISWMTDNDYRHKAIVIIILMLFGLPIMLVVVAVAIVLGVVEVINGE